ncbi:MAG TPA: chorismate mutase [bacterium]|nr:chorismate mutase [bacterium]HOX86998.1 chorismate mutase [bacterium]HPG46329.1 chorismate mutase [bacterium]HPM98477.1 chorismate mutase [bacterium]
MSIDQLRQEIDAIDAQLLQLLNARAAKAMQIGRIKSAMQLPITDSGRERAVIESLTELNRGPLATEHITRLFSQIIEICRSLQTREK